MPWLVHGIASVGQVRPGEPLQDRGTGHELNARQGGSDGTSLRQDYGLAGSSPYLIDFRYSKYWDVLV